MLIDFGASRIKAAVADAHSGVLSQFRDFPPFGNVVTIAGHFEISPQEVHNRFLEICAFYNGLFQINGILICSQMHGFLALDGNLEPISNYISWKDERSLEHVDANESTFELLQYQLGAKFKQITGMKPRPSFPFFNAAHWAKQQRKKAATLISLPDWLSLVSGQSNRITHDTMLAGLGFYDIYQGKISSELVALAKEFSGCDFSFYKPTLLIEVAGQLTNKNSNIPIYTGVGDLQCAILGTGNFSTKTISINIGTGSQVSAIYVKPQSEEVEFRPYFNKTLMTTITHIPAGRALEFYVNGFAKQYNIQTQNLWRLLSSVSEKDVELSKIDVNLAVFPSARGFDSNYNINDVFKKLPQPKVFLTVLVKALVKQYTDVVNIFDPKIEINTIQLSGGVARKLPVLVKLLHGPTARQVLPATELDETILGLNILAKDL